MNMGDELASSFVQITTHLATNTISTVTNLIAEIMKMLQIKAEHDARIGTDLSKIKPGEVSMRDLIENARSLGDSISSSEHGLSSNDAYELARLAKKYGIPLSFTNKESGDNIHAHMRTSDVPFFKQMMTDMMKEKLETRPQELGNFKVQSWEIPYITAELNKYNLNATFGRTKQNEYFCLYEKADERAILIARAEFINKYKDIQKNFCVDCDENGNYTIKDLYSGKEFSLSDVDKKSFNEVSKDIENFLGYDRSRAQLAAAKFGEENLKDTVKENYFDNPQNETHEIKTNIAFESDDVYCSKYTMLKIVPKEDNTARYVFSGSDGRFAVINPHMTSKEIAEELRQHLGIRNQDEINSLTGKAEKAINYFAITEDVTKYSSEYSFSKEDFNLSNIDNVKNMVREEDGHRYARTLPIDNLKLDIRRTDIDNFSVVCHAEHSETDEQDHKMQTTDIKTIQLTLKDQSKAMHELEQLCIDHGVPEGVASRVAFDTFEKAKMQETEKVVTVSETRIEQAVHYSNNLKVEADVYCQGQSTTININDQKKAAKQIADTMNVSKEEAAGIVEKADKKLTERQHAYLSKKGYECSDWDVGEASYVISMIKENNWEIPDELNPNTFDIKSIYNNSEINKDINVPEVKVPEIDIEEASIGGI